MSNKVEQDVVYTVAITQSVSSGTEGVIVDLSDWRTVYELESFATPGCTAVAGISSIDACTVDSSTTNFKISSANVVTTASTFSFSFTVRQGAFAKSAAVTSAKCEFLNNVSSQTIASFTPAVVLQDNSSSLTMKTTSSDTSKQCPSDTTKTQNGMTGVVAEISYTLGAALDLAVSKLTITLPMRLKAYSDASLMGSTTRESMLPTDATQLSVKIVHGSNVYWSSKITTTIQSDATNDVLEAIFSNAGSVIPAAEAITIQITGITNPPTTKALTSMKLTIAGQVQKSTPNDYKDREQTSGTLAVGLSTCEYRQDQASATAVIGLDTVGTSSAEYRFSFITKNVYPTTTSFRLTMPTDYSKFTVVGDYSLTCLTGCTAAASPTVTISANVITFTDVFTANIPAGTLVDLKIGGWTNPSSESVYSVSFETIWDSSNYLLDRFKNLGSLGDFQSSLSSSFFDSTNLIIRKATNSCRIRAPQKVEAARAVVAVQTLVELDLDFTSFGSDCKGKASQIVEAYALGANEKRLNARYAVVTLNESGKIGVTLTPAYDTAGAAEDHALFIQVTDFSSALSTNHFCVMINKAASTANYCRSFCLQQSLFSVSQTQPEYLQYVVSGSSTAKTYTDEFSHASQNAVMCPILYSGNTRESKTHSHIAQVVQNFDVSTGGFEVLSTHTAMILANNQGSESYKFQASTDAYTKSMPFTVYFNGCDEAFLVPISGFKIQAGLLSSESNVYTDAQVGFESSDPINCQLGTSVTATYTFQTTGGAVLLENYWQVEAGKLKVTRTTATELRSEKTIVVTATSNTVVYTNTITLEVINSCLLEWNCKSCSGDLVYDADLPVETQTLITSQTTGCTTCYPGFILKFAQDSAGNFKRQCINDVNKESVATSRRRLDTIPTNPDDYTLAQIKALDGVGATCGLGMLYSLTTDFKLACDQTCSSAIKGCILCASSVECSMCSETDHAPSKFLDFFGQKYSHCTTDLCVNCGIVTCPTNCEVCSNTNLSQCKACKSGYYMSGGSCIAISGTSQKEYYVQAATTDKAKYTTAELGVINSATGAVGDKFAFLQQVFSTVYSDASLLAYQKVTVTVTLETGDHFFFSCHNDLYASYSFTTSADLTDLCASVTGLQQIEPASDNIDFVFQTAAPTGTVVHVLDSYANFNVTGSMSFSNIEFRGENALAVPAATLSTYAHPPLATLAFKKCTVNTAPDGSHTAIQFTESTNVAALSTLFSCSDSGFQTASIPMKSKQECAPTEESTVTKSSRSCPGEPYHEDFFTFDSVTKVYYKRHRVLFNLYGWDRQRSYNPASRASLTLEGCSFNYFLADYESLINVQTNNIAVHVPNVAKDLRYIEELGDNRGIIIKISSSTFKNSRFCKGMLTFKKRPFIKVDDNTIVYSLSNTNSAGKDLVDDSQITITGSNFHNLNFGRVLSTISLLDNTYYPVRALTTATYPTFDNHGSVLNIQGFPGGIRIDKSLFTLNMVYVPEIYPSKRSAKIEPEVFENFINSKTNQVETSYCNDDGETKRFFSDFLTSILDQPSDQLSQLEKHSPIYIAYHENPLIIINNSFESNVGLFGGAIAIDTPNFYSGDFRADPAFDQVYKPYTVVHENSFELNQAYISGNAAYMRSEREIGSAKQSKQVCGAGVEFKTNSFVNNSPVIHGSNGGAVSIECDFITEEQALVKGASNFFFSEKDNMRLIFDPADSTNQYLVYRFAAAFLNNTFTGNTIGQKGSAIYSRQVSFMHIYNNTFTVNGPAYSFNINSVKLPYYKYLAQKVRQILFHEDYYLPIKDELEYMTEVAKSYEQGGLIDLPQSQGLVYYEMCRTCLVDWKQWPEQESDCSTCNFFPSYLRMEKNTFTNNWDNVAFYKEHDLKRASHFMSDGGAEFYIHNNRFQVLGAIFDVIAEDRLPSYTAHLPSDYFENYQTPFFRMKINRGIQDFYEALINSGDEKLDLILNDTQRFMPANITFSGNFFNAAVVVQPFIESQSFKGSLFQLESETIYCKMNWLENTIDDSSTLGGNSSLVYVEGASFNATDNVMRRSGLLNMQVQNFTREANYLIQSAYFPINTKWWSARTWTQEKGVFWLQTIRNDTFGEILTPVKHQFTNNTFSYLFCETGCVLTQQLLDMGVPTYTEFYNNTYSDIFALKGALIHTQIDKQSVINGTYTVLNATSETIERAHNGAYLIEGDQHETITVMESVAITDSFGSANHASLIHQTSGAVFACRLCSATRTFEGSQKLVKAKSDFDLIKFDWKSRSRDSFYDYLDQKTANETLFASNDQIGIIHLHSQSMDFVPQLSNITVNNQTIGDRLNTTFNEYPYIISGYYQDNYGKFWPINNKTVAQEGWSEGRPDFIPSSLLQRCNFTNITVEDQLVQVHMAPLEIQLTSISGIKATAKDSSVIKANYSKLVVKSDSIFERNDVDTGGAIKLNKASSLYASNSKFYLNKARSQAGALYAQDESLFSLKNCTFLENEAPVGGAITVENLLYSSATITNSIFERNKADQALMWLKMAVMSIDQTEFINNLAQTETPGFMISLSTLDVTRSIISQNITMPDTETIEEAPLNKTEIEEEISNEDYRRQLEVIYFDPQKKRVKDSILQQYSIIDLIPDNQVWIKDTLLADTFEKQVVFSQQEVVSGFFYAKDSSKMKVENTTITGIEGKVASAFYATSDSHLQLIGVELIDLKSPTDCQFDLSGVIVGNMAGQIEVINSKISGCGCSYIYSDQTPVSVERTAFALSISHPYIRMQGSSLNVAHSTFSVPEQIDLKTKGRGIYCDSCTSLNVSQSGFYDLQAEKGGAVYVKDSLNGTFASNVFQGNQATQGGAIYNMNSELLLEKNQFVNNRAQSISQEEYEKNLLVVVTDISTGGGIFFTCIDHDNPLQQYETTESSSEKACGVDASSDSNSSDDSECAESDETQDGDSISIEIRKNESVCNLIIDQNVFTNNTAESTDGQARGNNIFFTNKQVQLKEEIKVNCTLEQNWRNPLCADLRGPPIRAEVRLIIKDDKQGPDGQQFIDPSYTPFKDLDWPDKTNAASRVQQRLIFNSGQPIDIEVKLYDQFNNLTTPSDIQAEIQFLEKERPYFYTVKDGIEKAENNMIYFKDVSINTRPGSSQYMIVKIQANSWFNNPIFLEYPPIFIVSARACQIGEYYREEPRLRTCRGCMPDTFAFIASTEFNIENACPRCPLNAYCQDQSIYPEQGVVRFHDNSQIFVECFNRAACLRGNKNAALKNCAEGYEGTMCATCSPSYWKPRNTYECLDCGMTESQAQTWYIVQICIFLLIIFLIYRQDMRNFSMGQQEGLAIYRIIFSQYHILYFLNTMQDDQYNLGSYEYLKRFVDNLTIVFNPVSSLVAQDCLSSEPFQEDQFYKQVIIMVCIPPAIVIFNCFMWGIGTKCAKWVGSSDSHTMNKRRLVNRIAILSGIMIYVIYPMIFELLFQSVNCFMSLEESGPVDIPVSRLRIYPDIVCSGEKYTLYFYALFVPAILLYVFVIPISALYYMCKNSNMIYLSSTVNSAPNNTQDLRTIKRIKSLFGFFYAGMNLGEIEDNQSEEDSFDIDEQKPTCQKQFKQILSPISGKGVEININRGTSQVKVNSFFYWEFVIFYQKVLICLVVNILGDYNEGNQICIVFFIIIIFQVLQEINSPYYTSTLNSLQVKGLTLIQFFVTTRLIIRSLGNFKDDEDDDVYGNLSSQPIEQELIDVRLITVNYRHEFTVACVIIAFFFFYLFIQCAFIQSIYIHLMLYMLRADQKALFSTLVCKKYSPSEFIAKYSVQEISEANPEDVLDKNFVDKEDKSQEVNTKKMMEDKVARMKQQQLIMQKQNSQPQAQNMTESAEDSVVDSSNNESHNPAQTPGLDLNLNEYEQMYAKMLGLEVPKTPEPVQDSSSSSEQENDDQDSRVDAKSADGQRQSWQARDGKVRRSSIMVADAIADDPEYRQSDMKQQQLDKNREDQYLDFADRDVPLTDRQRRKDKNDSDFHSLGIDSESKDVSSLQLSELDGQNTNVVARPQEEQYPNSQNINFRPQQKTQKLNSGGPSQPRKQHSSDDGDEYDVDSSAEDIGRKGRRSKNKSSARSSRSGTDRKGRSSKSKSLSKRHRSNHSYDDSDSDYDQQRSNRPINSNKGKGKSLAHQKSATSEALLDQSKGRKGGMSRGTGEKSKTQQQRDTWKAQQNQISEEWEQSSGDQRRQKKQMIRDLDSVKSDKIQKQKEGAPAVKKRAAMNLFAGNKRDVTDASNIRGQSSRSRERSDKGQSRYGQSKK